MDSRIEKVLQLTKPYSISQLLISINKFGRNWGPKQLLIGLVVETALCTFN